MSKYIIPDEITFEQAGVVSKKQNKKYNPSAYTPEDKINVVMSQQEFSQYLELQEFMKKENKKQEKMAAFNAAKETVVCELKRKELSIYKKMNDIQNKIKELEQKRNEAYYNAHSCGIFRLPGGLKEVRKIEKQIELHWEGWKRLNDKHTMMVNAVVESSNIQPQQR